MTTKDQAIDMLCAARSLAQKYLNEQYSLLNDTQKGEIEMAIKNMTTAQVLLDN